ncbi:hypothetical protein OS145_13074 [Idiomarina baltica OS145]|uniref:Uncharacterized protein n=1 Tax=Idiomarina baltica OS145 TaxID=314276 RepID=A0ABM9WMI3_9GAMM|nr:hypothetical protein OS145_13074 [Idiomarina baltica OS145]
MLKRVQKSVLMRYYAAQNKSVLMILSRPLPDERA